MASKSLVYIDNWKDLRKRARAKSAFPSTKTELEVNIDLNADAPHQHGMTNIANVIERFNGHLKSAVLACCCDQKITRALNANNTSLERLELSMSYEEDTQPEQRQAVAEAIADLLWLRKFTLDFRPSMTIPPYLHFFKPLLLQPSNSLQEIKMIYPSLVHQSAEQRNSWTNSLVELLKLCSKSTRLKKLEISVAHDTSATRAAMIDLIKQNSTLQSLIVISQDQSEWSNLSWSDLVEALDRNRGLKQFDFTCGFTATTEVRKVDETLAEGVHSVLQKNHVLEELFVDPWIASGIYRCYGTWDVAMLPEYHPGCEEEWPADLDDFKFHLVGIAFLLALNRSGRGQLLSPSAHPTTEDWINAIARQNDASSVFYLLSKAPSLYDLTKDPSFRGNLRRRRKTVKEGKQGNKRQRRRR